MRVVPLPWPVTVLGAGVLFVLAVALPLATYATALALFGLAHVLAEVYYVDRRFGRRLGAPLALGIAALLAGVVTVRILGVAGIGDYDLRIGAEIGLVGLLAVAAFPILGRIGGVRAWIGGVVLLAAVFGLLVSPLHTLAVLAIVHNLTPLGFLAEALEGDARRRALIGGAVAFVGVPVLIATGLPHDALAMVGLVAPDATWLPTGPLSSQLGAYLHPAFHDRPWALHAFSGAVFAQCMHYFAVIVVLPRLRAGRGWIPWPPAAWFGVGVAVVAGLAFFPYLWSFSTAKAAYGVVAAVHAWVEVPILLVALAAPLTGLGSSARASARAASG